MNVEKYRASCNRLIRNPDDTEALVSQFANVSEKVEYGKHYLPLARRAYELAPEQTTALFNYASALHRTGHFESALRLYLKSLPLVDDEWRGRFLHHVALGYRALNQNRKACEYYLKAYEVTGDPAILKDRAIATLASGDLQEGFRQFEIRKECAARRLKLNGGKLNAQQKLPPDVKFWKGEDLTGKTLVIYHEEGHGDFIQFCRYIPKLRETGVAKIMLCGPSRELLELVSDHIAVDGIVPLSGPLSLISSLAVCLFLGVSESTTAGLAASRISPPNPPASR